jgi:23S rRNA (uracil1939-C5)-methyltransferase
LIEQLLVEGRYPGADEVILRCGARTGQRLAQPSPPWMPMSVPADVRTEFLFEEVAGRTWRISAHSFFQSRPDGAEALSDLVMAAAAPLTPTNALDLYSGVGLYAGRLASAGWSVAAVEWSKSAVADAHVNLADLPVTIDCTDATKWRATPADLAVANPARNGLGPQGAAVLVSAQPKRIVLVSCDLRSFGRDTRLLAKRGYRLTSVTPVDLFPHTFHLELVSVFDR